MQEGIPAIIGVAILAAAAAGCGRNAEERTAAAPDDPRTAIVLNESERAFVLAEMRRMLESTQVVVSGVATDDLTAVETAARASGMAAAADVDPALRAKLPDGFRLIGRAAHGGFDEIASLAAGGASDQAIMEELGGLLQQCTGCHATFRIETSRE